VADAYTFMTGKTLEEATPVTMEDMALPDDLDRGLAKVNQRLCDGAEQQARTLEGEASSGAGDELLGTLSDECRNTVSSSRKFTALGYPAAGNAMAVAAAAHCTMGVELLDAMKSAKKGALYDAVAKRIDKTTPSAEMHRVYALLDGAKIGSLDQQLLLLDVYGQMFEAESLGATSAALMKEHGDDIRMIGTARRICGSNEGPHVDCLKKSALQAALQLRVLAAAGISIARSVDLTWSTCASTAAAQSRALTETDLRGLGDSYAVGARAVMGYFDTLFTDELARKMGVSRGLAQSKVSGGDSSYLVALNALNQAQSDPSLSAQGRFVAAVVAYLTGANLVNRYFMATEARSP
jgi:hypothetical protein